MSTVHPSYKWADKKDTVWVTAEIPYVKKQDVKITLDPVGKVMLDAQVKDKKYAMSLQLNGRIRVDESVWEVKNDRFVVIQLRKLEDKKWTSLQKPTIKKPPYERIDWDKAEIEDSDESESDEDKIRMLDPDTGMDMSFNMPSVKKGGSSKANAGEGLVDGLDALLFLFVAIYIWICPFTKVEESFNLQATHDILFHRFNLSAYPISLLLRNIEKGNQEYRKSFDIRIYDHHEFPGVVPRTFLGPLVLSFFSAPLIIPFYEAGLLSKITGLFIVRSMLGLLTVTAFGQFRREVARKFGDVAGMFLAIITICQFHFVFYMSRPLPNVFALILVLFALRFWLQDKYYHTIAISVAAASIFRSELALLFGPVFIEAILRRRVSIWKAIGLGILSLGFSVGLSAAVDSYFWQRPTWPEGEVFFFNVVENKSHEWGTSPFHWYFTNALPRALMGAIPLVFIGYYFERQRLGPYLRAVLVFLVLYSFLPHKELRFVFPVIPVFNMAAAVGLARLYTHKAKWKYLILLAGAIGVLTVSHLASWGFLATSAANYPGGHAFASLHALEFENFPWARDWYPYVHIDNLAAISGVSRFGEQELWRYSKQEGTEIDYTQFTHLVSPTRDIAGFEVLHEEAAFEKINFRNFREFPQKPLIETVPRLFVLRKKGLPNPVHDNEIVEE